MHNCRPLLLDFCSFLGHEASHVIERGLKAAPDQAIWAYAEERAAVLITKDEDFRTLRLLRERGPQVVWLRIGITTTPALLNRLSGSWQSIIEALERGEPIVEVT